MQIFAYLYPYLFRIVHAIWTAQVCVDMVSFHDLLRSVPEFWHHLPVVLRIHNLLDRTCIWRAAGSAAEILSRLGVDHGNQPYLRILGWD